MTVAVLGHTGMLGRRVLERFPDALTFTERYIGAGDDPLLAALERAQPDWVINCIGTTQPSAMWLVNATLPRRLASRFRLIQPSTDHITDDTDYAASKRWGQVGNVIRCAIVDPDGGMLARARLGDTIGETAREWNGITAKAWAEVAALIMEGRLTGLVVPGSPTITHYDLLETARRIFGWRTRTVRTEGRHWWAEVPTFPMPPIEVQLAEYL